MKTNQLMKRDFDGNVVDQRTDNSFLNATDLLRIYNLKAKTPKRFLEFWNNKNTEDFIEALLREENVKGDNSHLLKNDLIIIKRGKHGSTYMHPYLFVKFAMWLSAEFEVKVIKWVYDNLIKVRHEAGDHYIEMCEVINQRYLDWSKGKKPDPLIFITEANYLKQLAFGYKDKHRNEASENELKLLNQLQLANIKLIKSGATKEDRYNQLRNFAILYN
jgi:hypothetical protein